MAAGGIRILRSGGGISVLRKSISGKGLVGGDDQHFDRRQVLERGSSALMCNASGHTRAGHAFFTVAS